MASASPREAASAYAAAASLGSSMACAPQPAQTDVVGPSFDQDRLERLVDDTLEKRNVLADELFLKADRVCRDDDAAALVRLGRQDGGDEVGEALADAGAGLDEQVMPVAHRDGDGGGHLELLRPELVAVVEPTGDFFEPVSEENLEFARQKCYSAPAIIIVSMVNTRSRSQIPCASSGMNSM